ncbi:hypothetical protein BS47DRAFT_889803 [Hydnum rufescens UP504]|uniref:Uncharacterized protein n=1 Tax=Hydnum rufescens UP504 TaxID=1448309 RepID=A0A9P6DWW9_9AGAM|nr:hypothetical protein BS47DRAFT_889803 [Hydnum rufescens UP504]
MSAFIGALLFANMVNMFLNGMFLVQLSNFCGSFLLAEPVFIRVIVFGFSIFDILQTAVMAYVALYACFGSHKSQIFVWLYSTIRLWSIPIYVAAYGFYTFQVQKLTDRWTIPVLIICLLVVQTGGAMLWTIGTAKAGTLVDLATGNDMTMAGTMLCTMGAFMCSLCIMISVIVTFRNSPVRVLPARRGVLRHLQIVSMRVHIPLVVITATDLVAYILFPKSHISTVIAIIVGKVWSNTLLHGLNSRQALRHAPVTATTLNNGIEFVPQWGQTSSSMNDSFTMELTEMGIVGPERSGDESGVPNLEQVRRRKEVAQTSC